MGLFGSWTFSGGQWRDGQCAEGPFLLVTVQDSDFATVVYHPVGETAGRFYLGFEPRVYYEDDTASEPVDRAAEAQGFAEWVWQVHGRTVEPAAVEALMADADGEDPDDDVVEETVARLLAVVGLPLPDGLTDPVDDDE
jgi:hypothetical protein